MNKYLKKFGIMFVMLLAVIGIGAIQQGVSANAATVGSVLTSPESGWKRYDDTDSKIIKSGTWGYESLNKEYKGGAYYTTDINGKMTFKFYGSKIRLINGLWSNKRSDNIINIDGTDYTFNEYLISENCPYQSVVFEKIDLSKGVHTVSISSPNLNPSTQNYQIDAVDIDDNGYLIDPSESISLNQSSMDINVGDTKQLTATTTPAAVGVTWASNDPSIATVDENGNVTGIKEGQVTITATTVDGLTATCTVNVILEDSEPTSPTTGDADLYIELVDGQIKQYSVSSDEINKFTEWYENRDKDHSLAATYKFAKGTYTDYVVHDQIDWFEVR